MLKQHIQNIKENGYTILPGIISTRDANEWKTIISEIYKETKDEICQDTPYLNNNQPNVYNLQNKSRCFTKLLFNIPGLEEILKTFLNDKWYKQIPQDQPNYILRSFGARSSNTALPLHIDSFIPYVGEEVIAMQVVICLEDMTLENGCTVAIPGSHKSGEYADNKQCDKAIPLLLKAGDIAIWDSRIWHGTTENKTESTRWAIIATFCRYWLKQQFDITKNIDSEIYNELTPKEKSILGFNSIPPLNEYEGIEMKRGYEK